LVALTIAHLAVLTAGRSVDYSAEQLGKSLVEPWVDTSVGYLAVCLVAHSADSSVDNWAGYLVS
jgi:hypothetical protein